MPSRGAGAIVTSTSDGEVAILRGNAHLQTVERWKAHDYESWIAAWDYWDTNSVWSGQLILTPSGLNTYWNTSGGDDCQLKLWDLRQRLQVPALVNKK